MSRHDVEKELRRAKAHADATKDRDFDRYVRWVNYADGLHFALDNWGAALEGEGV